LFVKRPNSFSRDEHSILVYFVQSGLLGRRAATNDGAKDAKHPDQQERPNESR
jgi:hypothetical protein